MFCPCIFLESTFAAVDDHEEDTDKGKDHEEDKCSMTQLYDQIYVILKTYKLFL